MAKATKKKIRPARNPVVRQMIKRSQKAGPHKDKRREAKEKQVSEDIENE